MSYNERLFYRLTKECIVWDKFLIKVYLYNRENH